MDATGPNAEQIKYWNEQTGPKWVAQQEQLDCMIGPYGLAAMAALDVRPGTRVIDVGAGCGGTALELARRAGPDGHVLGVDISGPMLAHARTRTAHLPNVELVLADAQTHAFTPGGADALFSRFGVMFFADPTAAFANLRRALGPGGRLGFACWQPMAENPWLLVPTMAAAQVVPLPPPPAPGAPGPFSLGDRDRVRGILSAAGFTDVAFEAFTPDLVLGGGGTLDEAVEFVLTIGPTAAALREAGGADHRPRLLPALREALAPYATPQGVALPSAAWVVTAR